MEHFFVNAKNEKNVKRAYRHWVLKLHPDKHPIENRERVSENFKTLGQEYEIALQRARLGQRPQPSSERHRDAQHRAAEAQRQRNATYEWERAARRAEAAAAAQAAAAAEAARAAAAHEEMMRRAEEARGLAAAISRMNIRRRVKEYYDTLGAGTDAADVETVIADLTQRFGVNMRSRRNVIRDESDALAAARRERRRRNAEAQKQRNEDRQRAEYRTSNAYKTELLDKMQRARDRMAQRTANEAAQRASRHTQVIAPIVGGSRRTPAAGASRRAPGGLPKLHALLKRKPSSRE